MVAPPKQKICLGQSVARLVEQSLPTQEIRSSNPVIGNFYFLSTDENKDKRQRFAELLFQILHSFNINVLDVHLIRFFATFDLRRIRKHYCNTVVLLSR